MGAGRYQASLSRTSKGVAEYIELASELVKAAPVFKGSKPLTTLASISDEDTRELLRLMIPIEEFLIQIEHD